MKKIILILLISVACSSNKDCCINIEADVAISVANTNGEDLLINNEYTSAIKVFYKLSNGLQLVNNSNSDAPKGFTIISAPDANSDKNLLKLYLNIEYFNQNNATETVIEFPDGSRDVVTAHFNRGGNNTLVQKIVHNNTLVWSVSNGEEKLIQLTK